MYECVRGKIGSGVWGKVGQLASGGQEYFVRLPIALPVFLPVVGELVVK